jgi:sulfur carrier protein
MKVYFKGKTQEYGQRMKVRELLKRLELSPQAVLVVKDNEVITEDEFLEETDEVRIITAISGG